MEVPDHREKEKKILMHSIDPTYDTAEEHDMPINPETSFFRSRYHLVDLQHPEPQLDIAPALPLYVEPGSMIVFNGFVYLFGGLHPGHRESDEYLQLGPNPQKTYPKFHFGASCFDLTPNQSQRVWEHPEPPISDSASENIVIHRGKMYTFGNEFLKPELFDPVVGQWTLIRGLTTAPADSYFLYYPLSDPIKNRIFVAVWDAQFSSTWFCEFQPPYAHPKAGNGGWKVITKKFKYWTSVAAIVENVIYFHSPKFPCLLRAYDISTRKWLKVGWDSCFEDGLNLNVERIEFTSLLSLGTRTLCFARETLFSDDVLDSDDDRSSAHTVFLKFQVKRTGETVNLIPISSHIYKIPFTSEVLYFAAV